MILRLIFCLLIAFGWGNCLPVQAQQAHAATDSSGGFSSRWHFGVHGGYGHRLFRPGIVRTTALENYIDDLKAGVALGAKATYYVWPKIGFGIVADRYQGSAKADDGFRENVTIHHLSASVNYRKFLKKDRTTLITSFMTGYQPYRNKVSFADQAYTFNGKTMGWGISVAIEQRISPRLALSCTGAAMMGAIYRMKRTTRFASETLYLSKDDSVDLSRASITLGLSFF